MGICTDGTISMTGKHSGAVACKKEKSLSVKQTHCMIHRKVLVAKHFVESLSEVLSFCFKVVKSIKACPFQTHMFSKFCNEISILSLERSRLLLYTDFDGCREEKY